MNVNLFKCNTTFRIRGIVLFIERTIFSQPRVPNAN